MWKLLFYKWFGVEPMPCAVCEVLREQLAKSELERRELLARALAPPPVEDTPAAAEELQPIRPQFIPWRIRQQMLEAEDRKKAQLMQEKSKEIADLEKELGIEATE